MAKIATDISQSKKLAEILPVKSADMYYREVSFGFYDLTTHLPDKSVFLYPKGIEAWSLSALMNYLREIDFFPYIDADEHEISMLINWYNDNEGVLLNPIHDIEVKAETFVDACVEMIIKLKEKNLL